MPLVSEVFNQNVKTRTPVQESEIRTTCPTCSQSQTLSEATVDQSDPLETIYTCRNDCGPVMIVSTPGVIPWEGRGYRLGDWLIRNPTDLLYRSPAMKAPMRMPASPYALD